MNTPCSSKPNPFLWLITIPLVTLALTFWSFTEKKDNPPAVLKAEKTTPPPPLVKVPTFRMSENGNLFLFCYNRGDVPPAPPIVAIYLYNISNDLALNKELIRLRDEVQKKIWDLGGTEDYALISKTIYEDVVFMIKKSGPSKARLEFPRIKQGLLIIK